MKREYKLLDCRDYPKVFVFGDIHGDFGAFFRKLSDRFRTSPYIMFDAEEEEKEENYDDYTNSVVIIAGDCGMGFCREKYYTDMFERENEKLSKNNTLVLMVRGNHDDPDYFKNDRINYSHIKCVSDYTLLLTIYGNGLLIGGALSIDRSWRIKEEQRVNRFAMSHKKKFYWGEDEMPVVNKKALDEIKEDGYDITFVVAHTLPSFAENEYFSEGLKEWTEEDDKLFEDLQRERAIMNSIWTEILYHKFKVVYWIHGHLHLEYEKRLPNVIIKGLDCNLKHITLKYLLDREEESSRYYNERKGITTNELAFNIKENKDTENNDTMNFEIEK